MLLDSGYCSVPGSVPGPAGRDDDNPFHSLYLRSFGDAAGQCFHGLDTQAAPPPALLELDEAGRPLEADTKESLFVDAFQYWRQDVDAGSVLSGDYSSSCSTYSSSPPSQLKTEFTAELTAELTAEFTTTGTLPHMIPGSRSFAGPRAASPAQTFLLHTGANVVDMVSGVTCSGVGLGALGAAPGRKDVIGDLTRPSSTALGPYGQAQRCANSQVRVIISKFHTRFLSRCMYIFFIVLFFSRSSTVFGFGPFSGILTESLQCNSLKIKIN